MKRVLKKTLTTLVILLFATCHKATGQDVRQPWEKYYNQLSELDDVENESWEEAYDILCDLADNKININKATREDLERIIFLTQPQIEEISEYIYKYGPLRTLGELSMIESLDATRRNLLSHFVYIDKESDKKPFPSLKDIMKYGRNELVATAKIPLYDRKGDKEGYLGYKYKHWFRYTFKYGQYAQIGLTGSQDAGEPFFSNRNRAGYDYYSFYLLVRKMGRLKTLALGRYRMRFGMGLVLNNDFSFGKIASLTNPNTSNNIRAHSSKSEANYMQGAAATYNICKGIDATAFVSYRHIDATPGNEPNTVTTILTSGYHRTESEMARKHNVSQTAAGGNIRYASNGFHAGATAVYTYMDKELKPNTAQAFRQYYLSGKRFMNVSTDYGYTSHHLSISGETAIDDNASVATINRVAYQPDGSLTLTLLQRFYSYKFRSFFGQCFSDGGRTQNESGAYLGANWTPSPNITVMAYTDYAYFAWPKYRISEASHSWDNFVSATYHHNNLSINARYRLRLRQRDNEDKTGLTPLTEQRARLAASYTHNGWGYSLQCDASLSKHETESSGWMVSQNLDYKYRWLTAHASLAYFDTDDYESRLYTYERGLLYSFSFPMFHGHGIRYTANIRAEVSPKLLFICKVGTTKYFDRNTISSSYQEINGSSMTDIEAQLKWRF